VFDLLMAVEESKHVDNLSSNKTVVLTETCFCWNNISKTNICITKFKLPFQVLFTIQHHVL
jgi:hypothetical protein